MWTRRCVFVERGGLKARPCWIGSENITAVLLLPMGLADRRGLLRDRSMTHGQQADLQCADGLDCASAAGDQALSIINSTP